MENVQESKLNLIASFLKDNGIMGIIVVLLFYFGHSFDTRLSEFNNRLNDITKEIISIKIELAAMNATYVDKDIARELIETKIRQHEERWHNNKVYHNQNK